MNWKYYFCLYVLLLKTEFSEHLAYAEDEKKCFDEIELLRKEIQFVKNNYENLKREIKFLRKDTESDKKEKRLLLPTTPMPTTAKERNKIAFFANSVIDYQNLGLHQTLIFGKAISNLGGFYNHATGMFAPNVSGYYVFSVGLLIDKGHVVRAELVVDGDPKNFFYVGDVESLSNGGSMSIHHITAGQNVWVRVRSTDGTHTIFFESNFSGYLLYED